MFDIESIIKKHVAEDGSIPAEAVTKLAQAVNSSVGREFVDKARYTEKLTEIETLKTEKQTAEDSATTAGKWKEKYEALNGEFENFKEAQTAKEQKAAKEAAVRSYYESKGITGNALVVAMRGSTAEIEALEMENGKIKDASVLDALVAGDFSGLVAETHTQGANTPTPPPSSGGGENKPNTRAAEIAARYNENLYGKAKE